VISELIAGIYDGLRGALYLVTHPRLWKFVLAPALVAAAILAVAVGSAVGILSGPIATIAAFLPGSWADNVLELLAGVVLTIIGFTLFLSIAATIAGPFNEMLSESIEERETGALSPPFRLLTFLRDLVVGIVHALRRVSVYLVVMIALFVLGIVIPVVGTALSMVLGAIATARFASWDAYDAVWSRRRLRYRDKVTYLRAHRWRTLGLGATVAILVIVPGLNVLGLAIGATGATLRSLSEVKRPAERDRAAT
jgi:CysZ protein